ncbi:MAG: deoxyribodipyrimidine photo-lyase [bacterium]
MNRKRVRILNKDKDKKGPIVYWMSRDQRMNDNWALIFAQELAIEYKEPLIIVFCLVPQFSEATIRQYSFMLKGLKELDTELHGLNIPFYVLPGEPKSEIPKFIDLFSAKVLITDFDPLNIKRRWKDEVIKKSNITIYEVDAHNVVPCWIASVKQEYSAYTIRPRINRLLHEFIDEFPALKCQDILSEKMHENNWDELIKTLKIDFSVPEVSWIVPGEKSAKETLQNFISEKLEFYAEERNDPIKNGQSNLSPYIHFGLISSQRIVLEVIKSKVSQKAKDAFLEELIIRKELADNFCYYNPYYDSFEGFPDWAKHTLDDHRNDERENIYSLKQFELAQTEDELWNAAQKEMLKTGKMHGYMRMYWAKKILQWSESPEEAIKIAIYLNDRYELDGRDPNGYTGIAWSIGGVHDRAWQERPIFGKIRYMSYNGCKSKFNVNAYISKIENL